MKIIKIFHLLISISAVLIALIPQPWLHFDNGGFTPYNTIMTGKQERLLAALIILSVAINMGLSIRCITAGKRNFHYPIISAALMGLACFSFYLKYFSGCSALFSILALVDALLISCLWVRHTKLSILSLLSTLLISTLLFGCSFICSIYFLFSASV